jgi:D-xylose transport system permease protein
MLGGGLDGAVGPLPSLLLALALSAWLTWRMQQRRRQQRSHGLTPRPLWFDVAVTLLLCAAAIGFALAMNSYRIGDKPQGQGIPVPVLVWAVVVMVVSFMVNRTRFGRYVYAIGGNPEAALLVGIPVRRVMLQLFLLLAALVTVAAIVAVARLNAGTNSLGTNQELYVIAAAVIGGVALSGGSGTVLGTVLGALVIQFLESGLLLLDVDIGWRMVIVGQVLIAAVVFDVLYRRATGERVA